MKIDITQLAANLLSNKELTPSQPDVPLAEYTFVASDPSAPTAIAEMEVRAGLCSALAQLSASMRSLLGLMSRHNFVTTLPDQAFPAYERLMDNIGTAATQGSAMVARSRELDTSIAMHHIPKNHRLPQ
ncbi:MAG: hypothetical protein RRY29_09930 [Desulfovibrionaceae bacterium]